MTGFEGAQTPTDLKSETAYASKKEMISNHHSNVLCWNQSIIYLQMSLQYSLCFPSCLLLLDLLIGHFGELQFSVIWYLSLHPVAQYLVEKCTNVLFWAKLNAASWIEGYSYYRQRTPLKFDQNFLSDPCVHRTHRSNPSFTWVRISWRRAERSGVFFAFLSSWIYI